MVHADSCSGAASFYLHKHIYIYIYSSKANTVAGSLFILRFLEILHLHRERGAWNLLRVRALLETSWKWWATIYMHFRHGEQGNLFKAPCCINSNINMILSRIAWRRIAIYHHIDLLYHL